MQVHVYTWAELFMSRVCKLIHQCIIFVVYVIGLFCKLLRCRYRIDPHRPRDTNKAISIGVLMVLADKKEGTKGCNCFYNTIL